MNHSHGKHAIQGIKGVKTCLSSYYACEEKRGSSKIKKPRKPRKVKPSVTNTIRTYLNEIMDMVEHHVPFETIVEEFHAHGLFPQGSNPTARYFKDVFFRVRAQVHGKRPSLIGLTKAEREELENRSNGIIPEETTQNSQEIMLTHSNNETETPTPELTEAESDSENIFGIVESEEAVAERSLPVVKQTVNITRQGNDGKTTKVKGVQLSYSDTPDAYIKD